MAATAWQTKLSSFKERNLYAYNKSLFCDVELSVMDDNGDKVTIPAHKYILAISSPIFEAMFYGESAKTGRTIDLPDCTKEGIQEMLRFVYSDEVNLTGSNVLDVLYLADKYMLPFLKEKCEVYLQKELKPEDIFYVLPQIRNEKVEQKCWNMVDSDTERAVTSESFLNISREMLCKVLGRHTLTIDEVVLFEAVEKWALNKLKEEGLEENMDNKRAVLGEDVIKLIRFPLMSQKNFAEKVLPSGILKMDEVTVLIQIFSGLCPQVLKHSFRKMKRGEFKVVMPNTRFETILPPTIHCWSCSGLTDAIDFKVNQPLFLAGVRLFGAKDSAYDVILALYKSDNKITEITSTLTTEDEEIDGYYGFTIHFAEIVPLDPDVVYTIEASISGPHCYYGRQGQTTFAFEDTVITYLSSDKSSNGTTAAGGQFPTMVFKKALEIRSV